MDSQSLIIREFRQQTGANEDDALRCLRSWGWDIKKALIDYNDTLTTEYFRELKEKSSIANKMIESATSPPQPPLTVSSQQHQQPHSQYQSNSNLNHQHKQQHQQPQQQQQPIVENDYKKLSRGISTAMDNVNLVSSARSKIAMDFDYEKLRDNLKLTDTHDYTFVLPDLSVYDEDFRLFLDSDLIDISALKSLEETKRLNWWVDAGLCRKLWPILTTGDGNCLLHAASLGMWGFHDRKLTLRAALHEMLSKGEFREALWRRWRFQQTKLNRKAGFVYSEIEWCKEWEEIVALSSTAPRQSFQGNARRRSAVFDRNASIDGSEIYESLEEIHVLALAHVLKRAIIVVSDTVLRDMNGEAMAPISFGGIYLPFEIDSNECYKGPLLLTYNNAHFSALVPMDTNQPYPGSLIPLIDLDNEVLPLQFCIDPGKNFNWLNYDGGDDSWMLTDQEQITLCKEYLSITYTCLSENLDYEIFENLTDEEFEKGLHNADVILNPINGTEANQQANNKSKAAKQLHSIAKQFGSIGKSVSKKIKKNLDSMTRKGSKKINSSESFNSQTRIPCAEIKTKRHSNYEQMIENYLICAQIRFVESENGKAKPIERKSSSSNIKSRADNDNTVNSELQSQFSPPANEYKPAPNLCYNCTSPPPPPPITHQPSHVHIADEYDVNELIPKYGTGKSKFYMQADLETHNMIKHLPYAKKLNELDQTLYLTNSTFFNDRISTDDRYQLQQHQNHHHQEYQPQQPLPNHHYNNFITKDVSSSAPPPMPAAFNQKPKTAPILSMTSARNYSHESSYRDYPS